MCFTAYPKYIYSAEEMQREQPGIIKCSNAISRFSLGLHFSGEFSSELPCIAWCNGGHAYFTNQANRVPRNY